MGSGNRSRKCWTCAGKSTPMPRVSRDGGVGRGELLKGSLAEDEPGAARAQEAGSGGDVKSHL